MLRIYFILAFLLMLTISSFKAHAGERSCAELFNTAPSKKTVNDSAVDFVAPRTILRQLAQQTKYSEGMRSFISDYSHLLNDLYQNRMVEVIYDGKYSDFKGLGFESGNESRVLKEQALQKQIRILTLMKSEDLTPEFVSDFRRMSTRIYSVSLTKADLEMISKRLDDVIKMYSFVFYSRM